MKVIKTLSIIITITMLFVSNSYAKNWEYESFAYWNSDKVVFLWSKYDSKNKYNNFSYYEVIRTNVKNNSSSILYKSYNRSRTRFEDKNPLLWQWSIYKTCTTTRNGRRFCTKPHKIYISFKNSLTNKKIYNKNYRSNKNKKHYYINKNNNIYWNITYSSHNYKKYYPYNDYSCPSRKQPASNPRTWECRVFSNPCEVPLGWKNVATCKVDNNELSNAMKRKIKTIMLRFVDRVVNKNIQDHKKLDILKNSINRFNRVAKRNDTRLSFIAEYSSEILQEEYDKYERDYSLDTWLYYQINEFLDGSY